MLIVYNQTVKNVNDELFEVVMDCHEYRTLEYPNRVVQEKIFRDMLYMNNG